MHAPVLYPCEVCNEDTDADTMREDQEINGIVCDECHQGLKLARAVLHKEDIRGVFTGECGDNVKP